MINVRKVKAAGLCDCCDKKKATYEVYCRISLGSFLSQALTKIVRYTYVNKVITALLNADKEQRCRFSLACMDAAKRLYCCPACESKDVERVMLACHPPIIDLKCKKCGWRSR